MNSHGDGSEQKGNDQFEDQLKEILYSGPASKINDNNDNAERPASPLLFHAGTEKRLSSSAEILIRIIAALMVIGLLICFGIQIAFR